MPATKKKKKTVSSTAKVEKQLVQVSEHMNMLLVVFSVAMMMFAYVLYKVYVM